MSQFWAVACTAPRGEPDARHDIEGKGFGTFLPHFAKVTIADRKVLRRHAIFPGYIFVALEEGSHDWGKINDRESGIRVLAVAGEPNRVSGDEIARVMLLHATGALNVVQHRSANGRFSRTPTPTRYGKRRRRPRRGKTIRNRAHIPASANNANHFRA